MKLTGNIDKLAHAFMESDPRLPYVVFKLLDQYTRGESISLDEDVIVGLLEHDAIGVRINRPEAAIATSQLKEYFEHHGGTWHPSSEYFNRNWA